MLFDPSKREITGLPRVASFIVGFYGFQELCMGLDDAEDTLIEVGGDATLGKSRYTPFVRIFLCMQGHEKN